MKESSFQKIVRKYLITLKEHWLPITHWRIPVEKRLINGVPIKNELRGFPDLLVCFRGRFVGIELKTKKNKLSKKQEENQLHVESANGYYFVARNLNDIVQGLYKISLTHESSLVASQDLQILGKCKVEIENIPQIRKLESQPRASAAASDSGNAEAENSPF